MTKVTMGVLQDVYFEFDAARISVETSLDASRAQAIVTIVSPR